MNELSPTYSVVLKYDLPPRERELLQQFCCRITSRTTQEVLLHFLCTKIDLSHHVYIEMETFKPGDTSTMPIRVPHQYVFLISGDESKPAIGFLSGSDLP